MSAESFSRYGPPIAIYPPGTDVNRPDYPQPDIILGSPEPGAFDMLPLRRTPDGQISEVGRYLNVQQADFLHLQQSSGAVLQRILLEGWPGETDHFIAASWGIWALHRWVGSAQLIQATPDILQLSVLLLRQEAWGRRIGSRVTLGVTAFALALGQPKIETAVVRGNAASQRMVRGAGFTHVGQDQNEQLGLHDLFEATPESIRDSRYWELGHYRFGWDGNDSPLEVIPGENQK